MSDGSEKRPLTKQCFGLYLLKQGRSYRLIHVMDFLKVVQSFWSNIVRLNKCVQMRIVLL